MFRRYWSLFILLIATYCSITVPLWMVFKYQNNIYLVFIEIFISAAFLADAVINYRFLHDDPTVSNRKKYLTTWFIVDLLAIPPYLLFAEYDLIPAYLSFLSIFRFLKIFKLTKRAYFKSIWGIREFERTGFLNLFILLFWIINFAHWSSCGWIKISGDLPDVDGQTRYIRALYWSVTTLTTIGYGDITPITNLQTIYAMFVMIIGAGTYGYLVAITASTLANADIIRKEFAARLQKVTQFMKYKNISRPIQEEVLDYYEYIWKNKKEFSEKEVLEDLPDSLKMKVIIHLNKELLRKIPTFKNASDEVIGDVFSNLTHTYYLKGDMIINIGEIGTRLFLINKGKVEVLDKENRPIATLYEGDFFGEFALLENVNRTAGVRALEYCDLYYLELESFKSIIKRHPQLVDDLDKLAKKRGFHNKET
ncbi:MAG: ion transporter [Chlamydiota bacterium]